MNWDSHKLNIYLFFNMQNYSLDKYKSKEEKLQLLDDAIASFDGNAILIVRNISKSFCFSFVLNFLKFMLVKEWIFLLNFFFKFCLLSSF